MFRILIATSALALTAATAEAATMKAEFTARVSAFEDVANVFGGQTADIGDTVTLTYLYDPDLAAPGWTYENPYGWAGTYGGSLYDPSSGYTVPSPVISASIKVGSETHSFNPSYYGLVNLAGFTDPYGSDHTYLAYDARGSDLEQLSFSREFTTETPSALLHPTLSASYSFDIPLPDDGGYYGSYTLYHYNEWGSYVADAYVGFNVTHAEISPYASEPTDPGPAPVPLPASIGLLTAAIGGLGAMARKRRPA